MRKFLLLVPLIAVVAIMFISGSAMVVEKVDVTATPQIAMLNEQVVVNGNVEAIDQVRNAAIPGHPNIVRSEVRTNTLVAAANSFAKNYDVANNSGRIQVNARDCCTVNNAAQSSANTANDVAEVTRALRTVVRC